MFELYVHRRSWLHAADARVKLILTLVLIIFLNLTSYRAWPGFILFLTATLSVAVLSRLGVGFVLKRALLAAPFVLAAVPLIFTGPPPVQNLTLGPALHISYSPDGLARFAGIAVKSWISVQAAILLAAATRFPDLMVALQELKVPKIFVAIISLMWRYLFVIGEEVNRMLRARSSRSASLPGQRNPGGTLAWRARVTGGMAGSLFLRSIERSDRVYAAMLSRGYNGELHESEVSQLAADDRKLLWVGLVTLAGLFVIGLFSGG